MQSTYTGRKEWRRDGQDHFAEVTIRALPSKLTTAVSLSDEVLAVLTDVFGGDFEYQRHNVWAAVAAHIDIATRDISEQRPSEATSFHAEVVGVRLSGNAGRKLSGFLLTVAAMNATLEYFEAWEAAHNIE